MINLKTLPVEQLKPAPYNPRVLLEPGTPAYERLERSISEFQLVQPIVWNELTGHVVSGHQRLGVLKNQGATEIEVAVVSLSLEREKALNVTLNNSQVGSDWDYDKLTTLITELIDLPEFDATLTGFSDEELRDFQFAPSPEYEPEAEFEEANSDVRVILEVPVERWESVQEELNELIARQDMVVHIQFPQNR